MMASTFAEIIARMSASMLHAAFANAAEKAHQQQQQQQQGNPLISHAPQGILPLFPLAPFVAAAQHQNPMGGGPGTTTPAPPATATTAPSAVVSNNINCRNGTPKSAASSTTKSPHQQVQNCASGGLPKRRKRPLPPEEPPPTAAQQQEQSQLTVPTERQPSSSPLSSRISSPDSAGQQHKARKLKLYAAEEKVDIIDYAKCIGNRAAGREFNVAESSIREWRKNEDKIRRQAETTAGCTQHFELEHPELLDAIDAELVGMIGEKCKECADWYGIGAKARELWAERVAASGPELDGTEMKITMGWVSRFMHRNEHRVPKIAPPIIATGNTTTTPSSMNGSCSAVSMVRSHPTTTMAEPHHQRETRSKTGAKAKRQVVKKEPSTESQRHEEASPPSTTSVVDVASSSSRRRKCQNPMRVDATCATLLTTTSIMPQGIQPEAALID